MARRIRYNRGSIDSTISAAIRLSARAGAPYYIYATAYGYTIETCPPPFLTMPYKIVESGTVTTIPSQEA